ncbi:MAG: ketose-bisphosphate aldolase [Candidatus Humimicrobiaceae bacterium]
MDKYKEFGFINTKEMFKKAYEEKYVVPAFNFVCLEQMLAVVEACMETSSPVILQSSANVRKYIGPIMVQRMAQACVEMILQNGKNIPVALNLDHGLTFEDCKSCVDCGFSSVMIDGSALPYKKNIELTSRVVEYAHKHDVLVEGELGILSGVEDEVIHAESRYTDPALAEDFVKKTGVDSLAISIGTSHGIAKMKIKKDEPLPTLRFDILEEVEKRLPYFPIVLHGASAILPKYVEMINLYGGKLEGAQGIPESQIIQATKTAVCKINIASDGWIAATAAIRKVLAENPAVIDPRKFLSAAREEMRSLYIRKIKDVFGCAGKA